MAITNHLLVQVRLTSFVLVGPLRLNLDLFSTTFNSKWVGNLARLNKVD